MRSYAFTVISHIVGIVLSTGVLFYCVHEEIIFCPTFCGIAILYFSIHLYFIQMRQVKYWRYVVDCLRQQDLIQIVRSPYEDKVMRELADDLSEALRSLRGRLMDEEVRRQYFESLLNKVDTAVLVTDREGAIEWKNRAADALLDTRCRLPNEFLEAIKAGKTVVRYGKPSVPQDWAIDATRIDLRGCERWIVSLKNIHSTLERNEMEAWQKLIRVLTHEIMNSITPVISLSETLSKRCKADPDDVRNRSYIQHGVNVIHRRSKGLLDFVENYRRLTRIASPVKTRILVKDFFSDLRRLCPEPSIRFRLPDEPLEWFADRAQMEQVFLNLLKNACEACAEKPNPEIIVAAQREGNELVFTVRDNGIGVLPEVIDRVFVPFFTTKPSGSGIGLSICKQIITLHGGHISVESENSNCGQESPKWVGKCPSCGEWNTYVEEIVRKEVPNKRPVSGIESPKAKPVTLSEIEADEEPRIDMHDEELNRVLGGGLVPGSLVLIGGEPGIGKSTLVLQTVLHMPERRILYISGEESARQLKLRADRLTRTSSDCLIVCETSLEQIYVHIKNTRPDLVIIDSIQTISTESIESSPGSIAQVRECSASILRFAKETHTPVLLIGHINKEGSIAGPKVLEHIVDTVLQFEGDQHYMYRILRSIKNRFGSTAELGIYEMRQDGLRQVSNPSELLLSQDHEGMSGVAIASAIEGVRPFLIETQALVSSAVYGNPQRSATGFDIRRMNMLLAVLEKRVGFKLAQKDVFLNIAGGLKVNDPAIDLAVISAILSSNMDAAIEPEVCMAGEIGLSGEIRPVNRIEQRIGEAEKLGFKRFILPKYNMQGIDTKKLRIELVPVRKVEEAFRTLFG